MLLPLMSNQFSLILDNSIIANIHNNILVNKAVVGIVKVYPNAFITPEVNGVNAQQSNGNKAPARM